MQIYRVIPLAVLCPYGQIALFNLLIVRVIDVNPMDIFTHNEVQCAIAGIALRSCFNLFEMFFEVKKSSFSSRFFSQIAPLSSLEEAVEPEVFHSQPSARTECNRTCSDCRGE